MSSPNPSRCFVVDDTDPSISYSGSDWRSDRRVGGEYSKGSTGTLNNGSISFSFDGQGYIAAYGTVPIQTSTTPTWTCSIDGVQLENPAVLIQSTKSSEDHWPLCKGYTGLEGTHTLDITILSPQDITFAFYLSYIVYEPLPSALIDENENVDLWIWGTDPSFDFSGQWDIIPNTNATSSKSNNSSARLDFFGRSVSVFAYTANLNPFNEASLGTYYVDGGVPTIFQTPRETNTTGFLFKTPGLEIGNHSLNLNDQAIGFSYLTIDHSIIQRSSSSRNSNKNGLSRPQLIGLAVALASIAMILFVGGFLFWRRRRQKLLKQNQLKQELIYTPFILPPTHPHPRIIPPHNIQNTKEKQENLQLDPINPILPRADPLPSTSTLLAVPSSMSLLPPITTREISSHQDHSVQQIVSSEVSANESSNPTHTNVILSEPIREVDSGMRLLDPEILPPLYTAQ